MAVLKRQSQSTPWHSKSSLDGLDMSSGGTTAGCRTRQEGLTTAGYWTCRQEGLTTAGCWTCCQEGRLQDAGHVVRRDDCRMLDMLSGGTDDCRMLDLSSGGTTAGCWMCCQEGRLQDAGHVVRMSDDCRMLDMSSGGTDDCRMLDMPSGGIAVHRADCKVKPMWPSRGRTRAAGRYR